ncbi:MAG: glycosyltransferase family 4 protein, partial [Nitrospirae bacterium]|nr:glycosyltransferase family 4 protein [Nitrospirota bacterium]
MHIAHITEFFYPAVAGIESAVYETAKRLVERGHRVTVYTSKSVFTMFNNLPAYEEIDGIRIKRFSHRINYVGTWFPQIEQDEDILHFSNYNINPHTFLIKKYYNVKPVILTFHGGFSRFEGDYPLAADLDLIAKWCWQYTFGKRYLRKIDKLIALNGWERNNLIKKGALPDRIDIVPNGIDEDAFKQYSPVVLDKPYILSLSRISSIKDLDHGIMVLSRLKDVYYVIAGKESETGLLNQLKKLAAVTGVIDRVIFTGEIKGEDKYRYLAGAEVVIVPSRWEMQSLTILESMAQGKIIVASNEFGNPYTIEDKTTGILYEYGDLD